MRLAVVTPTRGDRPNFFAQYKRLLERQTRQPDILEIVDYPAVPGVIDLTARYRAGFDQAIAKGCDAIVVMEDDDAYRSTYLEEFERRIAATSSLVVGSDVTYYYHVGTRRYKVIKHPGRASMMYTAIRPEVVRLFPWPKPSELCLDIHLWKWAAAHRKGKTFTPAPLQAIGIKHGEGFRATRSHKQSAGPVRGWVDDPGMLWLAKHVDSQSLPFYKEQQALYEHTR